MIRCELFGHKWDKPLPTSDGTLFQRIDCERCGESIDGVKLKRIIDTVEPDSWLRRELLRGFPHDA